ncbi:alpha/beta hydrolase fold protein [Calothrix sp. NIES-4101]|nr:alpha/beta hydrolase fold protein [Calothrix sp. NIES-4101]
MILNQYEFSYCLHKKNDKKLILFLHGFLGDRHEFNPIISSINLDYSYLIIDIPGHGETQVLGGEEYYSMSNIAAGIISLLDDLYINKCDLFGYSMGGRLALYLAIYYPDRFSKLILESASPGLESQTERNERIKQDTGIARKLERINTQEDFTNFLVNWYSQAIFGNIKNHPGFEQLIINRLQNNPQELAKSLRFMGTGCQPSLWEKLRQNQIPTLLLAGEDDPKFIDINEKMQNICRFCQFTIIPKAAHNTHLENTDEFMQAIISFI